MIQSNCLEMSLDKIYKIMSIQNVKNFDTKKVGQLFKLCKIREYQDGEVIIREGDQDLWVYILFSGKIRISRENLQIGLIEKSGEIFGEMSMIDSQPRSASVCAVGNTVCLALNTAAISKSRVSPIENDKKDTFLMLYRVFAEYMSFRLRAANDDLISSKIKIKRLIAKL